MPTQPLGRIEYAIDTGYITIINDDGHKIPAYWAHPRLGNRFAGIAMLHDWWGLNNVCRLLANFYAQMGFYVIAPDLFNGQVAKNPKEAMQLLESTRATRYGIVDAALTVLERHHRTTSNVAALGVGMGGTLALEAAVQRTDLEAAVAYGGFPQSFLGQFQTCKTRVLAIYGEHEPYTKPVVIQALRDELAKSAIADQHQVQIIPQAAHDFFFEQPTPEQRDMGKQVIEMTLNFLDKYLDKPDISYARSTI